MEHRNIWIGNPYRNKKIQQITQTDSSKSAAEGHHHHITDNSLLQRMIDNHVVLTTIEINHITDLLGNLHIDKIINKEIIGLLAHIDQVINQTGNQVLTGTMNTETDQIVQIEINIGPITNIIGRHLHTTDKITEVTLHTTVSSKINNIKETTDEEVIHPCHQQSNQEPIVDRTTEDP